VTEDAVIEEFDSGEPDPADYGLDEAISEDSVLAEPVPVESAG